MRQCSSSCNNLCIQEDLKVVILVEEIVSWNTFVPFFKQLLWKRTEWSLKDFLPITAKNEVDDKVAIWQYRAPDMQYMGGEECVYLFLDIFNKFLGNFYFSNISIMQAIHILVNHYYF
jgi:hypothetical protein